MEVKVEVVVVVVVVEDGNAHAGDWLFDLLVGKQ